MQRMSSERSKIRSASRSACRRRMIPRPTRNATSAAAAGQASASHGSADSSADEGSAPTSMRQRRASVSKFGAAAGGEASPPSSRPPSTLIAIPAGRPPSRPSASPGGRTPRRTPRRRSGRLEQEEARLATERAQPARGDREDGGPVADGGRQRGPVRHVDAAAKLRAGPAREGRREVRAAAGARSASAGRQLGDRHAEAALVRRAADRPARARPRARRRARRCRPCSPRAARTARWVGAGSPASALPRPTT